MSRASLGLAAAALLAVGAGGAQAAVISTLSNMALSATTPVTIAIPNSTATFSFFSASTSYGPGAAVSTAGSGAITTFLGAVTEFSAGAAIDGTGLFSFTAEPTKVSIPFSAADDFVGLAFTQNGTLHYGYAEVDGPTLVSYGVETAANTTILTGATTPVPEPATMALLLVGLTGLTMARRRT